jgi:hypothetical protein
MVPAGKTHRRKRHWKRYTLAGALLILILSGVAMVCKPLPDGLDFTGPWRALPEAYFLRDLTFTTPDGQRHHDQQIMDKMLEMIGRAESMLVLDQFLFNDFSGKEGAILRPLSTELTDAIVNRRQQNSGLAAWFITDPLNTLYGGIRSPHQTRLRSSGVSMIETRLPALRDSNPLYSAWWRILLRFWPLRWGPSPPNPLGSGRVPLRSYLDLLNFKANHRKTLVADYKGDLWGMISSANPHDASSAHHNVAVAFRGDAAKDLLKTEQAVAAFSDALIPAWLDKPGVPPAPTGGNLLQARILTERSVERAALEMINKAEPEDQITLAMFYLSSRPIIRSLRRAHARGVTLRILLDPNKDAFGRLKNGIPNRPAGALLHRDGIPVRWALTHGEQVDQR